MTVVDISQMLAADLSAEQITAELSPEEQDEVLAELDMENLAWNWRWSGRPSQILPVRPEEGGNDWSTCLSLGGRGAGKTLTGSQWIREVDTFWPTLHRAARGTRLRVALLGRTAADVRDTLVQGESGLLNVYPPSLRDNVIYTPSRRRVDLPGGGLVTCFSADKPDQLRGPQFHIGVADELAAHRQVKGADDLTAWQNMEFAVRLGTTPQKLATTTPKRVASIRKLVRDAKTNSRILIRRSRSKDNIHLDPMWFATLLANYGGTELGRQELDGEILDNVRGAMASEDILDLTRLSFLPDPPAGSRWLKFIGLDPSVSEKRRDEAGIVVVYIPKIAPMNLRHAYIVDDLSENYTPDEWAEVTVRAAHKHNATIIAEVNQGGALIKNSLAQVAKDMSLPVPDIRETWSSKAKAVRAEPVSVAIARRRVHMVGKFDQLEDELTSWVPTDGASPNRLDAMVFGVVAGLFEKALVQGSPGSASVQPVNQERLDLKREIAQPRPAQAGLGRVIGLPPQRSGDQRRIPRRIGRTAV